MREKKKGTWLYILPILLVAGMVGAVLYQKEAAKPYEKSANTFLDMEGVDAKASTADEATEVVHSLVPDVELENSKSTSIGGTSYYYSQQCYEGIPIAGYQYVTSTDAEGNVMNVSGEKAEIQGVETTPKVSEDEASEYLQKYCQEKLGADKEGVSLTEGRLIIYTEPGDAYLAYEYHAQGMTKEGTILSEKIVLNAENGQILSAENLVHGVDAAEELVTLNGNQQSYPQTRVTNDNGTYYLETQNMAGYHLPDDLAANWWNGVCHFFSEWSFVSKPYTYLDCEQLTSENKIRSSTVEGFQKGDADAYANVQRSLIFLSEYLGLVPEYLEQTPVFVVSSNQNIDNMQSDGSIKGLDSAGSLSFPGTNEQGEPNISYVLILFPENNIRQKPYSMYLDVVGHEVGHSVVAIKTGDSSGADSGSLNEAYADIIGTCVESHYKENFSEEDWKIYGKEDELVRNAIDPVETKKAVTMKDYKANDSDPYYNSTIISHAAYLMWEGAGTEGSRITNMDTMAEMWIRSLPYLSGNMTMQSCCTSVLGTAKEMMLVNQTLTAEQYKGVVNAFVKVNLLSEYEEEAILERDLPMRVVLNEDQTTEGDGQEEDIPDAEAGESQDTEDTGDDDAGTDGDVVDSIVDGTLDSDDNSTGYGDSGSGYSGSDSDFSNEEINVPVDGILGMLEKVIRLIIDLAKKLVG